MSEHTHDHAAPMFTDREKALLIPVLLWITMATGVALFVYNTILSKQWGEYANSGPIAKVADAAHSVGALVEKKIPTGELLNIPTNGLEYKLLEFIEDSTKVVDKTTWFDFDRLLFDTGKATLQTSSYEQLGNIAKILKAFPAVNVKVGGYTDNVGDKAANLTLSSDRAKNVAAEIAKLGVAANRLEAEGYGDEHPVASNDTEEGRAQNRRISLRVTKK
jgi:outer membrane protein OmpA-like peptidoglycan-associated protein